MRRVHELVPGLLVAGSRVVLHHLADKAAFGVEDCQARSELGREGEQVELGAEPPVVTPLGLLDAVQMGFEGGLRLPGGPVDPLQLGPVLVPAPVGPGNTGELEVAQPVGRGYVGAATEVDEAGPVPVGADFARTPPGFGRELIVEARHLGDPLDDLPLVRLVGEELEAF